MYRDLQEIIASWGNVLMASGGVLKPVKCFYSLISFNWKPGRKWQYAANEKDKEFAVGVPTPGAGFVEIEHIGVNIAKKTLGVYLYPTGDVSEQIKSIYSEASGFCSHINCGLG